MDVISVKLLGEKLENNILGDLVFVVLVIHNHNGLVWQPSFLSSLSATSFLKNLTTVALKNFSKFLNYILQNIKKNKLQKFLKKYLQ